KLEGKKKKRTHELKRLYKVGLSARMVFAGEEGLGDQEDASKQGKSIADIDQDKGTTLVNDTQGRINEEDLFGIHDLSSDEVFVDVTASKNVKQDATVAEKKFSTADLVTTASEVVTAGEVVTAAEKEFSIADPVTTASEVFTGAEDVKVSIAATIKQISKDGLTLAQILMEIKAAKPKAKGVTIQDPSELEQHHLYNNHNLHRLKTKSKSFEEVQQAFNKIIDWVNNFVAMDSESIKDRVVESSKRAEKS
nr:hypothetical protein [Tanacetum cinerariifolium]